jgi:hypothetical protein
LAAGWSVAMLKPLARSSSRMGKTPTMKIRRTAPDWVPSFMVL